MFSRVSRYTWKSIAGWIRPAGRNYGSRWIRTQFPRIGATARGESWTGRKVRSGQYRGTPVSRFFPAGGQRQAGARSAAFHGLEGSIIHWRGSACAVASALALTKDREIVFAARRTSLLSNKKKEKEKGALSGCSGSCVQRAEWPGISLPGDADSCESLKIQDRHYSPVRPRVRRRNCALSQPWEEFARDRETFSPPSISLLPCVYLLPPSPPFTSPFFLFFFFSFPAFSSFACTFFHFCFCFCFFFFFLFWYRRRFVRSLPFYLLRDQPTRAPLQPATVNA